MAISFINELLHRSDASGSKSTILKPLTWLLSLLIGGLVFIIKFDAPSWVSIMFGFMIGIILLLFSGAYLYCLVKDRDALRSEKFSIQKMAIEKGIYGDNLTGILDTEDKKNLLEQGKPTSQQAEIEE